MSKKQDKKQFEQEVKKEVQKGWSLPVNGCLYVIILSALACMAVKGCKMVNMKYEEQKAQHEIYMDSINKVKAIRMNTMQYKGK